MSEDRSEWLAAEISAYEASSQYNHVRSNFVLLLGNALLNATSIGDEKEVGAACALATEAVKRLMEERLKAAVHGKAASLLAPSPELRDVWCASWDCEMKRALFPAFRKSEAAVLTDHHEEWDARNGCPTTLEK